MQALLNKQSVNLAGVCAETGLSQSCIYKLKNGSMPNAQTLVVLADHFGLELAYFFEPEISHGRLKEASGQ